MLNRCQSGIYRNKLATLFIIFVLVSTAVSQAACQPISQTTPLPTVAATLAILPSPTQTNLPPATATATVTATAPPPTRTPTPMASATPTATPTADYQLILNTSQPQGYLNQFPLSCLFTVAQQGPGWAIVGELPREQMHQQLFSHHRPIRTIF